MSKVELYICMYLIYVIVGKFGVCSRGVIYD